MAAVTPGAAMGGPGAPGRTVGQQIWRAASRTLALVAAILLIPTVIWGVQAVAPWASEQWARVFGDPSMRLADGFVLPTGPGETSTVTVAAPPPASAAAATLEKAFGGPVRMLATTADVVAASHGTLTAADVESYAGRTLWASTASGIATIDAPDVPGPVVVRLVAGGPLAGTTAAMRAAVLRRVIDGVGWTSGRASDRVDVSIREQPAPDGGTTVWAQRRVRSTSTVPAAPLFWGGPDMAEFDAAGRLTSLTVPLDAAARVDPLTVVPATTVWEAARHHDEDLMGTPGAVVPVVVSAVSLAPAVVSEGDAFSGTPAFWGFEEAGTGNGIYLPAAAVETAQR